MLGSLRIEGLKERSVPGPSSLVAVTIIMVLPTVGRLWQCNLQGQGQPQPTPYPGPQAMGTQLSIWIPMGCPFRNPATWPREDGKEWAISGPQTISPSHPLPTSQAFCPNSSPETPSRASPSEVPDDHYVGVTG